MNTDHQCSSMIATDHPCPSCRFYEYNAEVSLPHTLANGSTEWISSPCFLCNHPKAKEYEPISKKKKTRWFWDKYGAARLGKVCWTCRGDWWEPKVEGGGM